MSQVSIQDIVASVERARRERINSLLAAGEMRERVIPEENLSRVKIRFIEQELRTLAASGLDLVHYATVIKKLQAASRPMGPEVDAVIMGEIEAIINRYKA